MIASLVPGDSPQVLAWQAVRHRMANAAILAGRNPGEVTLVAVSKGQPETAILPLLEAGQRVFGESRVQEARRKWPALKARYPDVVLHLIGPLQTNKMKEALGLFDTIQTLNRPKLAHALADAAGTSPPLPRLLVQVNTGEESQKSGAWPGALADLLEECRGLGLQVEGLMCIPPLGEPAALHFALLHQLASQHGLGVLSMGMSEDFETAIAYGATCVRVGTALFGKGDLSPPITAM